LKKFISAFLALIMLVCLTACSSVNPGQFKVSEEYINEKLEKNGFRLYADSLDKGYGGGTVETEVTFNCYLKDKNQDDKMMGLLVFHYKDGLCDRLSFSNSVQSEEWKDIEKKIAFVCDLYGAKAKDVVSAVTDNLKNNENTEIAVANSIKTEFFKDGLHYSFSFLPKTEGNYSVDNLYLITMIITEENKYNADKERAEKARLKLIADNPLLYSDGEPDYTDLKTAEEVSQILNKAGLPFSAVSDGESKTDIGTANISYLLNNKADEAVATVSAVRYASGHQLSVINYVAGANDLSVKINGDDMLKVACELMGADYSDKLLKNVIDHFETDELTYYFEYEGYYWRADYNSIYNPDGNRQRYLHNITVYEPDVFKGVLLSWINSAKQNGQDYKADQAVYDRFFG